MSFKVDESLRLKRMARFVSGKRKILDIACAQNFNPYLNNEEVIGVDINMSSKPDNYTSMINADALSINSIFAQESFDAILAGEFIEHIEDPIGFLRLCFDLIKHDGLLVISTPNPNSLIELMLTVPLNTRFFYTEEHFCLYPQRWLMRMMHRAGFTDVKLYSGGFPLPLFGLIPFPRVFCYQYIAVAKK